MKKEVYIFVLFIFLMLFLTLISIKTLNLTGNAFYNKSNQECKEINTPYETIEEYNQTIPYTDQECENKKLSYKSSDDQLNRKVECIEIHEQCKSFRISQNGEETCNEYEIICDKYRETASFQITNLDNQEGQWTFEWKKSCINNQETCQILDNELIKTENFIIDPTETKKSTASITYNHENKEHLFVSLIQYPSKEICRDVIKHKDIIKTRKIIQYKKETVC